MSRTADYTIKGFLYQFNKTLLDVITSDDGDIITVEGLVEDVDIEKADGSYEAIQCKYHESRAKFNNSLIYKPILQMAETFSNHPNSHLSFTLYLHCKNETLATKPLQLQVLDDALKSKDQSLIKIIDRIKKPLDKSKFISKVKLQFGPAIDKLEGDVKNELKKLNLHKSDIDCILYPNALNKIAKLSSLKNVHDRKLSKSDLIDYLSNIESTLITKWTLLLKNKNEILKISRAQLSTNLNHGDRLRYFYFNEKNIADFDSQIVNFISNYIKIYHSKPKQMQTPMFAVDISNIDLDSIVSRLYKKGINCNTGLIGKTFEIDSFYKEPIVKIKRNQIEQRDFEIRLLNFSDNPKVINHKKCDDLIIISNEIPSSIDTLDTNYFQLGVENFNELQYIMNIRDTYE